MQKFSRKPKNEETSEFPKQGTYQEQKKFVDTLPKVNEDDLLNQTINTIGTSKEPFSIKLTDISPEITSVEVYKHSESKPAADGSDSEDENEKGAKVQALTTRTFKIEDGKKFEETYLHIPGETTTQLFNIKFNPDGSTVVRKKELPSMAAAMKNLSIHLNPDSPANRLKEAKEQEAKEALVIEAKQGNQTRYGDFRK